MTAKPLLVLLHGLGSDERDLLSLAAELDSGLSVVSIRAPYETGYGGFAWFDIQFLADGKRIIDDEQAVSSRELLLSDLHELVDSEKPSHLILGGFSQGAMMAAGILLRTPEMLAGAWLMSGRFLPVFDPRQETPVARPVLVQHGLYDEVLAIDDGRDLAGQ